MGRRLRERLGYALAAVVVMVLLVASEPRARVLLVDPGRFARLYFGDAPARLPVPVDGVAPGQLIDSWHAPRSGGRRHEGIDIFAPRGTPVRATTEGLVVRRGENRLGGRVVSVLGPGGQIHYYAHLEAWSEVDDGDWVDAGTVLGYVGNSGNAAATPPHLHYGIYRRALPPINPFPLLTTTDTPVPAGAR